jgi:hypothetical protein
MADLGAVGKTLGAYTAAKNPVANRLAGVGWGRNGGVVATSNRAYSGAANPLSYAQRKAGAGGSKGTGSDGGGGGTGATTHGFGGAG